MTKIYISVLQRKLKKIVGRSSQKKCFLVEVKKRLQPTKTLAAPLYI